ncbi:hypothetical protein ACFY05_32885 [Microtetraspora fusca]|uniref:Uncharacterized protein n=1 Tax=Microtetraspora fusca TaxID=1997 RepID=A0ABW6VE61_MICFU
MRDELPLHMVLLPMGLVVTLLVLLTLAAHYGKQREREARLRSQAWLMAQKRADDKVNA